MNTINLIRENNRLYNKLTDAEVRAYVAELKFDSAVTAMQMMGRLIQEMTPAYAEAKRAEMLKLAWTKTRGKPEFSNWAFARRFSVTADGLNYTVVPEAETRYKNRNVRYDGVSGVETGWVETSITNARISFRMPVFGRIYVIGLITHQEEFAVATGRTEIKNTIVFEVEINGKTENIRVETRSMAHVLDGIVVCEHPGSINLTLNPEFFCPNCKLWHGEDEFEAVVTLIR